jgi:hypothetical protein
MASMESAYKGQTIMKPATRLFCETVKLYREDRAKYNQLLKEARSMVANQQTTEESFAAWLSDKVSPSQLSQIWSCYHEIEAFCQKINILKKPLFTTTDLDIVKRVQKTVSQNKIFTITHRKRIKSIILAAQYYTAFIKEQIEIEAQKKTSSTTDTFVDNKEIPVVPESIIVDQKDNSDAVRSEEHTNAEPVLDSATTLAPSEQPTEEQFFTYLRDTARLSGKTCRDYITATRIAESFARQHGFTNYCILGNSSAGTEKVIGNLLKNDEFVALNLSHHHRYTAAFNRYIAFCQEKSNLNLERQYEEQYPSLYSRLMAASKVYDDPDGLSLERICSIIGTDDKNAVQDILDHVSWATKNTVGIYSFSKKIPAEFNQLSLTEHEEVAEPDDYSKGRFIEVLMQRYRNGMMFDSIDFDIFRETYEMLFEEQLTFDDSALEARLRNCGILYKDRLFPADGIIDPETRKKLFEYIDGCFASGKTVLYYKAIFADLASELASCYTLADEEMLRAYIEYTAEKGKYYLTEKYLSVEKNVVVDHNAEVADYLLSAGKPMSTDNVCDTLSHIPGEQIRRIITTDTRFLRNSKGEYFHEDIFEISEAELEEIAEIINEFIQQNEYAIWTDMWNEIQDKMPEFLENNLYLSGLGIRNVLAKHLDGRFNFEGAVISMPKDRYAMRDIYQLYAKHHAEFTANDIYNLSRELDTVIYFEPLAEVSVRVSLNRFVSKELIQFDVDAVDKAIGSFVSKEYIRIREIDSYLVFPNVGYEWNEYLLESFVYSYSKKFSLLHNGFSLYNVAGAVVRKSGAIQEFVDACAAVLADAPISLTKNEALNYLADANMITRRSYRDLDMAIKKATQIRDRKG